MCEVWASLSAAGAAEVWDACTGFGKRDLFE